MSQNQTSFLTGEILIVDDTPNNLRLLSKMLAERGHAVRKALNGRRAIASAQADPPDLILLDIKMPDMNGYQICQNLKTDETTREIPVIFISALGEALDKVKAFNVGGADYITKPFQIEEVLARIKNQLTIRHQYQQIIEQNEILQQEIRNRASAELALQKANQKLQRLAALDELTQVSNRRRFNEYLAQEWLRLAREGNSNSDAIQATLSLLMCDVDHFKLYNDTYGHQLGDNCLQQVASAISRAVKRPADLVSRYGGEEFAVILPNTPATGAVQVAEAIQLEIQQLQIPHASSPVSEYVTLSIGITGMVPTQEGSPSTLVMAADAALYEAKAQGRNRAVLKIFSSCTDEGDRL